MKLKLKIISKNEEIKGREVMNVPIGTVVKVLSVYGKKISNETFLVRIDLPEERGRPFTEISPNKGTLWGTLLEPYIFLVLKNYQYEL